jgi:hypothetical protein
MPDTQIHPTGTLPAPADFLIPPAAEILLKGAFASFDGSGAAGAFKPLLRIISDAGTTALEAVADDEIAAGASADCSWFRGGGLGATAATGSGVLGAYFIRVPNQTFGPAANHPMLFDAGSLISNAPSVFTAPDNFTIALAHGGLVMAGLVGEFGTNGGVPYTGEFEMQTEILDSNNVAVDQLMGPDVREAELYATDPGDDFRPNGYSIWNCDDAIFTPPYKLTGSITVSVNVTFFGYAMYASILSPTGLS